MTKRKGIGAAILIGAGVLSSSGEARYNNSNIKGDIIKCLNINFQEKKVEKKDEKKKDSIHTKYIKDLKESPFETMKVKRTLWAMLGENQALDIINNFNTNEELIKSFSEPYKTLDSIQFPLIYPELKEYFPNNIKELFSQKNFKKFDHLEDHEAVIIVSQCENKKTALGYYKEGKLFLASYVSAGKTDKKTISGEFNPELGSKTKVSRSYDNAPMPYAIQIKGPYYLHQGNSNGKPRSHGCIRVPWFYQQLLYKDLETIQKEEKKAKILLHGIYKPTLKKREETVENNLDTDSIQLLPSSQQRANDLHRNSQQSE